MRLLLTATFVSSALCSSAAYLLTFAAAVGDSLLIVHRNMDVFPLQVLKCRFNTFCSFRFNFTSSRNVV